MQCRGRLAVAQAYNSIIGPWRQIVAIARDRINTMLGRNMRGLYGTQLPDPCADAKPGGESSRRLIRMGVWNPMNLASSFRMNEISQAFPALIILALIGTARKEWTTVGHSRSTTAHHKVIRFGYEKKGALTNRSAGCALLIGHPFTERQIHRISLPLVSLRGRGGAVTIL